MASKKRFVVECTWSGYRSGQEMVCHRTVETRFRERYEKLFCVRFTDGTDMRVKVRDAKPRERVRERHGYDSLLEKIIMKNLSGSPSVLDVN